MNTVLSPEDHEHFIEHGYVLVRDVVPPEQIERTVAMLEASSAHEIGRLGARDDPAENEMVDACVTERLRQAVGELFGETPFTVMMRGDRPRVYEPEAEWRHQGAHVDLADPIVHPEGWAVGAWVALTRMPSHGGAFMFAPDSPRRFRALGSRRGFESIWTASVEERGGPLVEFLAEPGDAILVQHLIGHAGSLNTANPQARRVIDVRFEPEVPVRPGEKAFAEMSTLERANSMSYLASRFDDGFVLPEVNDHNATAAALQLGFSADAPITAQVAFRWEAATYLAYVTSAEPEVIALARTTDWVHWQPVTTIASPVDVVRSLHFDARYGATLTVAGESASAILNTETFEDWRLVTIVEGMRLLRQRYVIHTFAAKAARGQVCFYLDATRPHQIRWRSLTEEPNAEQGIDVCATVASWPCDGAACTLPEGAVIEDALITATVTFARFALVADLDGAPMYELSELIDEFTGTLEPLGYDTDTPPRRVRIYERGVHVWLVTYLRDHAGDERVFWGLIDWSAAEPRIRELTTGAALREGLGLVGLL